MDLGFTMRRNGRKHEVWEHPSGYVTTISHGSKSGDPRGWRNEIARLRRMGIVA